MLVLTRKRGETIRIGQDIVVKVIQAGRGTIKLGIEAPPHVRVLRGELEAHPDHATNSENDTLEDQELEAFLKEFGHVYDFEFESSESLTAVGLLVTQG